MFRDTHSKVGRFTTKAKKITHTKTLSVHVPHKVLKLLVRKARRERTTISEVTREVIWRGLEIDAELRSGPSPGP